MKRSCARSVGPSRLGELLLLAAIVLLAFVRGSWALGDKSLWWDESLSLHRARLDAGSILSGAIVLTDNVSTQVTIDDHPPLYFLLLAGSVRLLGTSEFALRYLSLACMVLTVALLYATGRRLVGRPAGTAAALVGAVSPMYLWYGQEARPYALVTLLGLLSFYSFLRAFLGSPGMPRHRGRQVVWVAVYLLVSSCMVLSHYLSILLVLFELAVLAIVGMRMRRRRRPFLASIVAVLLVALAAVAYALHRLPGGIGSVLGRPGVGFVPLQMLTRDLLNSFSLGLSVDVADWYVWLADLLFLAFVALGFLRLIDAGPGERGRRSAWLLAGYLVVPVALIYFLSYLQPAYMTSRHLMLVTPAFYLLLGAGLTWLRGRLVWVSVAGWLVVIAGVTYSTRNYLAPEYDKDPHRAWGAYLREKVRPGDVVVVDPPQIADLYAYYAGGTAPWVGLPLLGQPRQQTERKLQELLDTYDRVWLANSRTPGWGDPDRVPETWLHENAYCVDYRPFESLSSGVLVATFLPRRPLFEELPGEAQPIDVRYMPSLRLAGYFPVSAARPGESLHVQLYWAVDEPIPSEASMSLRLVDGEGHLVGQSDRCPFNGLFPMWQWAPGSLVRDEQEVFVRPGTPPGTYELELVLVEHPGELGCAGPPGRSIVPMSAPVEVSRGDRLLLGRLTVERATTPPSPGSLEINKRSRVRFGGLELVGSSVEATEVRPGERIHLRLYWLARQVPLPDLEFRLVLKGAGGRLLDERVIRPVGDAVPATAWRAQDLFEGQFWLQVPADASPGQASVGLTPVAPARRSGLHGAVERLLRQGSNWVRLAGFRVPAPEAATALPPQGSIAVPEGLNIQVPMLATLGDQVRFLGYDVDPPAVNAGQPLTVTLYWQALTTIELDYTVFVHLLGPDNQVLGQKDDRPRSGTYPTTEWKAGEVISDTHTFAAGPDTPPGSYPLEVGLYRLETLARLPVVDAEGWTVPQDRVLLGEVTVRAVATAVETPMPVHPEMPNRVYLPLVEANP